MPSIFFSRKFWLLILDTVISLVLHFTAQGDPQTAENVKILIGSLQPVFAMIIYAIALEDAAEKSAILRNWPGVNDDPDAQSKG